MNIEYAQIIHNIKDLDDLPKNVTRVYFGNEFCDRMIPQCADVQILLHECTARGLDFTLQTPFLTTEYFNAYRALVCEIFQQSCSVEFVVNDWGLLHEMARMKIINNQNVSVSIGKLLGRQKTDPLTSNLDGKIPEKAYMHFCSIPSASSFTIRMLQTYSVQRMEIENVPHPIVLPEEYSKISFSLHYPFVSVATTRLCPAAMKDRKQDDLRLHLCNRECVRSTIGIDESISYKRTFYFRGNTLFYEQPYDTTVTPQAGITRLVRDPAVLK